MELWNFDLKFDMRLRNININVSQAGIVFILASESRNFEIFLLKYTRITMKKVSWVS